MQEFRRKFRIIREAFLDASGMRYEQMKATIVFLVFSIGSWLLSRLFKSAEKDDFEDRPDATGTITRNIQEEGGTIMFYVSFADNQGRPFEGQSISYSSTKGKYRIGDSARIKYHITKKGRALVSIIDDDLTPCRLGAVKAARNTKIASIVFIVLAVVALVLEYK